MMHILLATDWWTSKEAMGAGGVVLAAIIAGLFALLKKGAPEQKISQTANLTIEASPKQEQTQNQTTNIGLDEKGVERLLDRKLGPIRDELAGLKSQLAPRQPVPESGDPLKIKAVELYNEGLDLQRADEIPDAIRKYHAAIELDPEDAAAHYNLGIALHDKGDLDESIASYRKAIEIDPNLASPHYNLGGTLMNKGDLDGAIAPLRKAIEIDPRHAAAHFGLGNALKDKGDLDGAIASYRKAIDIDPNLASAHYNLGVFLVEKGDLDGAIASCRKASEIAPKDARPHFNLGCFHAVREEARVAVDCLRKAIELDAKHRERAKTDKDFDPIRDDHAFRKLIYGE